MKLIKTSTICMILLFLFFAFGCKTASQNEKHAIELERLETAFEQYREPAITHRRFKHADIQPLIQKHSSAFEIEELGESVERKSISSLTWGEGQTKVLLWSQMHGNESTATMSLFDLFNFLEATGDAFDELRQVLKSNLQIKFIPMLNPDGADAFKRRNALDIDLNRDAISQISPEAVILKSIRDAFEPEFGFNLHDQQIYYNVDKTPKQATISVLAPGYNYERDVNEVRARAMKAIVGMNEVLQQVIPGGVGKYDDGFEPRAFGDNIQKWGTSTILIESGGYVGDPEKQFIRKLNFMIILNALHQIALKGYEAYSVDQYFEIPDNGFQLMDLILQEVQVPVEGEWYPIDIAIRRRESNADSTYYVTGSVDDLGDMQVYFGLEELDANGLRYEEGKTYDKAFESVNEITGEKALELLRSGYSAVKVQNGDPGDLHNLPLIVLKSRDEFTGGWQTGSNPTFFLKQDDSLKYALINGYLIDLQNPQDQLLKQRIY
jgi:hypothetical protein